MRVQVLLFSESNDGIHLTARLQSSFNFTCSVIANPFVNITITRNNEWLATIGRDNLNKPVVTFNESASGVYDYMFIVNFKTENEPYISMVYCWKLNRVKVNSQACSMVYCWKLNHSYKNNNRISRGFTSKNNI
jgi:hypothetical protein